MQPLQKIFANLVMASMLLGQSFSFTAPVANYDKDDDDDARLVDTLRLKNVTFPWGIPVGHPDAGGFCAAVPATLGLINPVDNKTDRVRKIEQTIRADGSQVIVQDDRITGTAIDGNGDTYQFVYKNVATINVSPGQPATVDIKMSDVFRLRGHGLRMKVSFLWTWTYSAPDGVTINLDPFVGFATNPLIFATADGVNPAPGVTNWEQIETEGDPFNCDPL